MSVKSPLTILAQRMHSTLQERYEQLRINILGWHGGRPYIEERLSRFAGESRIDWEGGQRQTANVTGRLEQAHCLPYLNRIVDKINQYVFGTQPERPELDNDAIKNDISSDGQSLFEVMNTVNSYLTTCGWCWMKIDAPQTLGIEVSAAEKAAGKVRPYWSCLSPLRVVDWKIDNTGRVLWAITQWWDYLADHPKVEPIYRKRRSLWEIGQVTHYTFDKAGEKIKTEQGPIPLTRGGDPLDIVPLFPVGRISTTPHFFDNTEGVNRSIMNLGSCNYANFFRTVFPQIYLPKSVLDATMEAFKVNADEAANLIMGYNYPIMLQENDPQPGYIMPDAAAIGTIRSEIKELVQEMYGTIGLIIPQENRSLQSGISKEFDFQDIISVVRERATLLETAEAQAVAISRAWDSDFPEWTAKYNRNLDVGKFTEQVNALVAGANMSMPDELMQFILEQYYYRIKTMGSGQVDPEREQSIIASIEAFAPGAEMVLMPPATEISA